MNETYTHELLNREVDAIVCAARHLGTCRSKSGLGRCFKILQSFGSSPYCRTRCTGENGGVNK
jgi:hypothetical protein